MRAISEAERAIAHAMSHEAGATAPAISKEDFERQISAPREIALGNESLPYVVIEPERVVDETPVVFVGGFGTSASSYRDELMNLAESGRKVVFVNPEVHEDLADGEGVDANVPPVIISEAEALKRVLAAEEIGTANFVAHSRGAAVATAYVAEDPRRARKLVLDSPAGLTGKESAASLVVRAIKEGAERIVGRERAEEDGESAFAILRRGLFWKLTKEIPAIAHTDIVPLLRRIQEHHTKGSDGTEHDTVAVSVITAHGDKIFTPERFERALGEDPFAIVDAWANYSDKEADHGKISRPEPGAFPAILDEAGSPARAAAPERKSVILEMLTNSAPPPRERRRSARRS